MANYTIPFQRELAYATFLAFQVVVVAASLQSYTAKQLCSYLQVKNIQAHYPKDPLREGDGCYHVFLDVGSNRGVHGRFLFEPSKYPKNGMEDIFAEAFGTERANSTCVFAFEPNPAHVAAQRATEAAYSRLGWRYKFFNVAASDRNGSLLFNAMHPQDTNGGRGFSTAEDSDSRKVALPCIDMASWIQFHIMERVVPKQRRDLPPRLVMKMDVEGSEYAVLVQLLLQGLACKFHLLFMEPHHREHVRLRGGNLENPDQVLRVMNRMLRAGGCRQLLFADTEKYWNDGQPLPSIAPTEPWSSTPAVREPPSVGTTHPSAPPEELVGVLAVHRDVEDSVDFLKEWVLHHAGQVDRVYLAFHQVEPLPASPSETALAEEIAKGIVTVTFRRQGRDFPQDLIYRKSLLLVRTKFLAVVDTDEFMVPTVRGQTVRSLMQTELSECDKVEMRWMIFISNMSESPKSARTELVWRLPFEGVRNTTGQMAKFKSKMKTMSRVAKIKEGQIMTHGSVMDEGAKVCQAMHQKERQWLFLFHYRVRSRSDWLIKRRHFVNGWEKSKWNFDLERRDWAAGRVDAVRDEEILANLVSEATCHDSFLLGQQTVWGGHEGATERCFGWEVAHRRP